MNKLIKHIQEESTFLTNLIGELECYNDYTKESLVVTITKMVQWKFGELQDELTKLKSK